MTRPVSLGPGPSYPSRTFPTASQTLLKSREWLRMTLRTESKILTAAEPPCDLTPAPPATPPATLSSTVPQAHWSLSVRRKPRSFQPWGVILSCLRMPCPSSSQQWPFVLEVMGWLFLPHSGPWTTEGQGPLVILHLARALFVTPSTSQGGPEVLNCLLLPCLSPPH